MDRSSYALHWRDPNVRGSRWLHDITLRDSDDGQGWSARFERPFYSLDSRWSAGIVLQQDETIEPVYRLGERVAGYEKQSDFGEVRFGRSDGLREGWVRRMVFGLRREHAAFADTPDETAPGALPQDRRLDYPFLRIEGMQDDFETTRNRDQIARTEDQRFGVYYALEFGWSTPALGADRNAALLHAEASRGWRLGSDVSLFADGALTSRVEDGSATDSLLSAGVRYYRPTGPNGVFFAGASAAAGHELDADHELMLGGDTGLRGYPLRFQTGSGTALLTIEERYYTKYSLWKIADVGAAVFFDAGRAWGESAFGPTENQGLLEGRRLRAQVRQHAIRTRQRAALRRRLPAGRAGHDRSRPVPDPDEAQFLIKNSEHATPVPIGTQRFWLWHFWLPAAVFLLAATLVHGLDLDRRISRAWFFEADSQAWIGAGQWWAINLIHRGGSALVWSIGISVIATLLAGLWMSKFRSCRRKAAYLVVGMALCATLVGASQARNQCRLPTGPRGLRRNPSIRAAVRRPAGWPSARAGASPAHMPPQVSR